MGSGATFAIGTTTVHCTATDAAGNVADGTFDVQVLGASEQLANLIADVQSLTIKPVAKGILLAHLVVARVALHTEHPRVACLALRAFIQQVDAYSGKWLSAAQAAALRADAQRIRTVIDC